MDVEYPLETVWGILWYVSSVLEKRWGNGLIGIL